MTTNQKNSLNERVDEEAMRWAMDFDDLSKSGRVEFDRWLAVSDLHEPRFKIARREWQSLSIFAQLQQDPETQSENTAMEARKRSARNRRNTLITAVAATVAAVAISITWLLQLQHDTNYSTAIGEQLTVSLPDGSTILLNTDTSVFVSYTLAGRTVQLKHGEVYFQVAHERRRPFVVVAGSGIVRAIGTAFNVYVHEKQVEVTVTEGEVEISQKPELPNDPVPIAGLLENRDSPVNRLTKGHNARITDTVEAVAVVDPAVLQRKMAWQQGWLQFVNMPLGEVVAEVDRYTVKSIVIEDPALESRLVTLAGAANDIDKMLQALDDSSNAFNVLDNANGQVVIWASQVH